MTEMTKEYREHMEQVLQETFRDEVVEKPFLEALEAKNYPRFYALLKRLDEPMPLSVCQAALDATCQAFTRAVDHGPLAWEKLQQLAFEAARGGRWEHLTALLERGAQVDIGNQPLTSPLVGAVWGGSMKCLEVLLNWPGVTPFYPGELLDEWARGGMGDIMLDFCLQTIADKWMPDQYSPFDPLPIPQELKLEHAVGAENWPLALRMGREGRVTAEDFQTVIQKWPQLAADKNFLPVASAILAQQPELAEDDRTADWLVMAALESQPDAPDLLRPIREALGRRAQIVLNETFRTVLDAQSEGEWSWKEVLERWEERLGHRPRPVLDRNDLPFAPKRFQEITWILQHCPVIGEPPANRPSSLARWLRWKGSVEAFRAALEPGGALEGENLNRLLNEIPTGTEASAEDRAKRAALLARMTCKEVSP